MSEPLQDDFKGHQTKSDYWEGEIHCDICGVLIAYGFGDLNCTGFACPKCYDALPEEPPLCA